MDLAIDFFAIRPVSIPLNVNYQLLLEGRLALLSVITLSRILNNFFCNLISVLIDNGQILLLHNLRMLWSPIVDESVLVHYNVLCVSNSTFQAFRIYEPSAIT